MDCDRCGKRLEFVNVQRHYESDLCKRKFTRLIIYQANVVIRIYVFIVISVLIVVTRGEKGA